jgi:hypothetical protein
MRKPYTKSKLVLGREQVRHLTSPEFLVIVGGKNITDGSNATMCLPETVPGTCQDNTAHFCTQV